MCGLKVPEAQFPGMIDGKTMQLVGVEQLHQGSDEGFQIAQSDLLHVFCHCNSTAIECLAALQTVGLAREQAMAVAGRTCSGHLINDMAALLAAMAVLTEHLRCDAKVLAQVLKAGSLAAVNTLISLKMIGVPGDYILRVLLQTDGLQALTTLGALSLTAADLKLVASEAGDGAVCSALDLLLTLRRAGLPGTFLTATARLPGGVRGLRAANLLFEAGFDKEQLLDLVRFPGGSSSDNDADAAAAVVVDTEDPLGVVPSHGAEPRNDLAASVVRQEPTPAIAGGTGLEPGLENDTSATMTTLPTTQQFMDYLRAQPLPVSSKTIAKHFKCTARDINHGRPDYIGVYENSDVINEDYMHSVKPPDGDLSKLLGGVTSSANGDSSSLGLGGTKTFLLTEIAVLLEYLQCDAKVLAQALKAGSLAAVNTLISLKMIGVPGDYILRVLLQTDGLQALTTLGALSLTAADLKLVASEAGDGAVYSALDLLLTLWRAGLSGKALTETVRLPGGFRGLSAANLLLDAGFDKEHLFYLVNFPFSDMSADAVTKTFILTEMAALLDYLQCDAKVLARASKDGGFAAINCLISLKLAGVPGLYILQVLLQTDGLEALTIFGALSLTVEDIKRAMFEADDSAVCSALDLLVTLRRAGLSATFLTSTARLPDGFRGLRAANLLLEAGFDEEQLLYLVDFKFAVSDASADTVTKKFLLIEMAALLEYLQCDATVLARASKDGGLACVNCLISLKMIGVPGDYILRVLLQTDGLQALTTLGALSLTAEDLKLATCEAGDSAMCCVLDLLLTLRRAGLPGTFLTVTARLPDGVRGLRAANLLLEIGFDKEQLLDYVRFSGDSTSEDHSADGNVNKLPVGWKSAISPKDDREYFWDTRVNPTVTQWARPAPVPRQSNGAEALIRLKTRVDVLLYHAFTGTQIVSVARVGGMKLLVKVEQCLVALQGKLALRPAHILRLIEIDSTANLLEHLQSGTTVLQLFSCDEIVRMATHTNSHGNITAIRECAQVVLGLGLSASEVTNIVLSTGTSPGDAAYGAKRLTALKSNAAALQSMQLTHDDIIYLMKDGSDSALNEVAALHLNAHPGEVVVRMATRKCWSTKLQLLHDSVKMLQSVGINTPTIANTVDQDNGAEILRLMRKMVADLFEFLQWVPDQLLQVVRHNGTVAIECLSFLIDHQFTREFVTQALLQPDGFQVLVTARHDTEGLLSAGFSLGQVYDLARSGGGGLVGAVHGLMNMAFTHQQLLEMARFGGAEVLNAVRGALPTLGTVGFQPLQIIQLLVLDDISAEAAFGALQSNLAVLQDVSWQPDRIIEVLSTPGGVNNLAALTAVRAAGFTPEQVADLVQVCGVQTLPQVRECLDDCKSLGLSAEHIMHIVAHCGGMAALLATKQHSDAFSAVGFTPAQVVKIVGEGAGSNAQMQSALFVNEIEVRFSSQPHVYTTFVGICESLLNSDRSELLLLLARFLLHDLIPPSSSRER